MNGNKAMKRLLRNKANFEVPEGFLSELLHRKIIIKHIGESERNKTKKRTRPTEWIYWLKLTIAS